MGLCAPTPGSGDHRLHRRVCVSGTPAPGDGRGRSTGFVPCCRGPAPRDERFDLRCRLLPPEVVADIGAQANFVGGDVTSRRIAQGGRQAADGGGLAAGGELLGPDGWDGSPIVRRVPPRPGAVPVHPEPQCHRDVQCHDQGGLGHGQRRTTGERRARGDRQHGVGGGVRRPDRAVGLLRVEGRHRGHDAAGGPRPGRGGHQGAGHRPRPVRHAAARHAARGSPHRPRPVGQLPQAPGQPGRVRRAGGSHRHQQLPERRGDPARRRASGCRPSSPSRGHGPGPADHGRPRTGRPVGSGSVAAVP